MRQEQEVADFALPGTGKDRKSASGADDQIGSADQRYDSICIFVADITSSFAIGVPIPDDAYEPLLQGAGRPYQKQLLLDLTTEVRTVVIY